MATIADARTRWSQSGPPVERNCPGAPGTSERRPQLPRRACDTQLHDTGGRNRPLEGHLARTRARDLQGGYGKNALAVPPQKLATVATES